MLAFPSEGEYIKDFRFSSYGRYSEEFKQGLTLADALQQPGLLRRYLDGTKEVIIAIPSDYLKSLHSYEYLGKLDPKSALSATQFYLTLTARGPADYVESRDSFYNRALLAAMQRRSQSDEDQFTKITQPALEFVLSKNEFWLVSQRDIDLDIEGRPLYMKCHIIIEYYCQVGFPGAARSYALRSGAYFSYKFAQSRIPLSKLRDLHHALKNSFDSLIIDGYGLERAH